MKEAEVDAVRKLPDVPETIIDSVSTIDAKKFFRRKKILNFCNNYRCFC